MKASSSFFATACLPATLAAIYLPAAQAADYVFNTTTLKVESDASGTVWTNVKGQPSPSGNLSGADGTVSFQFSSDLAFASTDRIYFSGSRPVRIIVNGDLTIPAGAVVDASAGVGLASPLPYKSSGGGGDGGRGSVYGTGGLGPTGGPGGGGGPGGTGGSGGSAASTTVGGNGAQGQPGSPGTNGNSGGSGTGSAAADGWGNTGSGALAPAATDATGGGSPGVPATSGGFGGIASVNTDATNGVGGAGNPGGAGGIGSPGAGGANGLAGKNSSAGSARGMALIGGGGGSSGSSGGGGGAGGSGGGASGGGGGAGGKGTGLFAGNKDGATGGRGQNGGAGGAGGRGGDGGFGGSGGGGGGAFELRATGDLIVGGSLISKGGNGQAGSGGTIGASGIAGSLANGGTPPTNDSSHNPAAYGGVGGTGGRGGDGGSGGQGGNGGGGAGGAIILNAKNVRLASGSVVNAGGGAAVAGAPAGEAGRVVAVNRSNYRIDTSTAVAGTVDNNDGSLLRSNSPTLPLIVSDPVQGRAIQLTADGALFTRAIIDLPLLEPSTYGFTASFRYKMNASSTPADGFALTLGSGPDTAPITDSAGPEGYPLGLGIGFDTYNNAPPDAIGHAVSVNRVDVPAGYTSTAPIVDGQWHLVRISCLRDLNDQPFNLSMTVDGNPVFTNLPVSFSPQLTDRFAFTAATGGASENLYLPDITVTPAPLSPQLKIQHLGMSGASHQVRLTWKPEPGASYILSASSDLVSWADFPGPIVYPTDRLNDTSSSTKRFFKIREAD